MINPSLDQSKWKGICKNGQRQSPIMLPIEGDHLMEIPRLNLRFYGFRESDYKAYVINDGRTGGNLFMY